MSKVIDTFYKFNWTFSSFDKLNFFDSSVKKVFTENGLKNNQ
ncbi:hypothetical protein [Lactococcus nasutitermitis]